MQADLDDDDVPDVSFEARTDDGRRLTNMLASVCINSKQREASTLAWCEVTDHGMTFTVGVAKSLQAIAYVKREGVFHAWWLADEHRGDRPTERLEFGINLATLLECLRIFGGASVGGAGGAPDSKAQLHLNFKPATACLNLSLVEGHSVTECEVRTLDIEAPHRLQLHVPPGERLPARIVVESDTLKSGIDELDWGGDANRDKRVALRVCPRPAQLSLTVSATDIGCEMVFPADALLALEATHELAFEYRFLHLAMALRSLKDSHQCQLQLDASGLLEIKMRFSAAAPKGSELFSHFFLFPLLDEDDAVDENYDATNTAQTAASRAAAADTAAWDDFL